MIKRMSRDERQAATGRLRMPNRARQAARDAAYLARIAAGEVPQPLVVTPAQLAALVPVRTQPTPFWPALLAMLGEEG